jgi:hypothetical protein
LERGRAPWPRRTGQQRALGRRRHEKMALGWEAGSSGPTVRSEREPDLGAGSTSNQRHTLYDSVPLLNSAGHRGVGIVSPWPPAAGGVERSWSLARSKHGGSADRCGSVVSRDSGPSRAHVYPGRSECSYDVTFTSAWRKTETATDRSVGSCRLWRPITALCGNATLSNHLAEETGVTGNWPSLETVPSGVRSELSD